VASEVYLAPRTGIGEMRRERVLLEMPAVFVRAGELIFSGLTKWKARADRASEAITRQLKQDSFLVVLANLACMCSIVLVARVGTKNSLAFRQSSKLRPSFPNCPVNLHWTVTMLGFFVFVLACRQEGRDDWYINEGNFTPLIYFGKPNYES